MLDWLLNANSLQRLGAGLEQTVKISLLALVFSSLLGLGFGLLAERARLHVVDEGRFAGGGGHGLAGGGVVVLPRAGGEEVAGRVVRAGGLLGLRGRFYI